jgi:hypothetical protein
MLYLFELTQTALYFMYQVIRTETSCYFCLIRIYETLVRDCRIKKQTQWRLDLPLNLTLFPIYLNYFHLYLFEP